MRVVEFLAPALASFLAVSCAAWVGVVTAQKMSERSAVGRQGGDDETGAAVARASPIAWSPPEAAGSVSLAELDLAHDPMWNNLRGNRGTNRLCLIVAALPDSALDELIQKAIRPPDAPTGLMSDMDRLFSVVLDEQRRRTADRSQEQLAVITQEAKTLLSEVVHRAVVLQGEAQEP